MNREIPIFFTIDDNYAPYLAAALNSAVKNSSKDRKYRAIVLYKELSGENMKKLSSLCAPNFDVDFYPMEKELDCITDKMENRLRCDYFTLTIYFRLFIPEMFPEYDKGIYIDSDVILMTDIAELFDTDIGDNYIGGCCDTSVLDFPGVTVHYEQAVGISRYDYINSGVLLMNLKVLREKEFDKHFLNLLTTYHFDSICPDQDYINAICAGKIYHLSSAWDTMPNDNHPERTDIKLIHYNLFSKPWCYDGVQYGKYFWEYAEDCGYIDWLREYKKNYDEEKKASDKKCFDTIIKKGDEIWRTDVTFKKLYESGVKIRL